MQIESIILIFNNGTTKRLDFQIGKLNIITGGSKTGKSALQEIVEYCLGSSKNLTPAGIIRENVEWYALILKFPKTKLFIARKEPKPGKFSSEEVRVETGKSFDSLDLSQMKGNTNVEGAMHILNRMVGITDNIHEPGSAASRPPLAANFHHAMAYCFQNQSEIDSKKNLFHRQDESFFELALKDTFPYLIGAISEDDFANRQELRNLKQRQKELERQVALEASIAGSNISRATSLIKEAKSVGLVSQEVEADDFDSIRASLEKATRKRKVEAIEVPISNKLEKELAIISKRKKEIVSELSALKEESRFLRDFQDVRGVFSEEVGEQSSRLLSLRLFDEANSVENCPICGSSHINAKEWSDQINNSIKELNEQVGDLSTEKPAVQALIAEIGKGIKTLQEEYVALQNQWETLFSKNEQIKNARFETNLVATVVGRISLFLEAVVELKSSDGLRKELDAISKKISALEKTLSREASISNLASAVAVISKYLSQWAKDLKMEHSEHDFRFDLNKLTVVADRPIGPIPFNQMGSGENWVDMHLIVHFGLHKLFIERKRPVPRFLMLDQPSQSQFPVEKDPNDSGDLAQIVEDDRLIISTMYKFIKARVEEMNGSLQVIVTDHADIKESWFQDCVIVRWRGTKLVSPENVGPKPTE